MKSLTAAEAECRGIHHAHEIMDNGECRYRLRADDGTSYIRTETVQAGWQNAHHHEIQQELMLVSKGRVLYVYDQDDEIKGIWYEANENFLIPAKTVHTLYLDRDTVLHTIKYGSDKPDWIADEGWDMKLEPLKQHLIKAAE